jgi:hypothetical protein
LEDDLWNMGLASILGTSRRERGGRCQTRRIGVGAKVMGLPVAAWLLNVFKWFPKSWGFTPNHPSHGWPF